MVKIFDPSYTIALKHPTKTLAWAYLFENLYGDRVGITTFHEPFLCDGITFESSYGFNPTGDAQSDGTPSAQNIASFFGGAIAFEDLLAGVWDYAEISAFRYNYLEAPTDFLSDPPNYQQHAVYLLGKITVGDRTWSAELKSKETLLDRAIGDEISEYCRYELGDSLCSVNLANHTYTGTILAFTETLYVGVKRLEIAYDSAPPASILSDGKISFASGNNAGLKLPRIAFHDGASLRLRSPLPRSVQVGDAVSLTAGCSKTAHACLTLFNNRINFGGEDTLPGRNLYSGTIIYRQE